MKQSELPRVSLDLARTSIVLVVAAIPLGGLVPGLAPLLWELPARAATGASLGLDEAPSVGVLPLTLVVTVSPSATDLGQAVVATALPGGGTPPYDVLWIDSEGGHATGPTWRVVPTASGSLVLTAAVTDPLGERAAAVATVSVNPPPAAELDGASADTAAGAGLLVDGALTGGTPPFLANLTIHPSGYATSFPLGADGRFTVPTGSPTGANASATLVVRDAVGAVANATAPLAAIGLPAFSLVVSPTVAAVDVGEPLHLLLRLDGGVPPLACSVDATAFVGNESLGSPPVTTNGTVAWTGTFSSPGNVTVVVSATDGAGRSAVENVSVRVAPALVGFLAVLTPAPSPSTPLRLRATIAGGAAPYAWVLFGSDGEAETGNLTGPGSVNASLSPTAAGPILLTLEVVDGFGDPLRSVAEVTVVDVNRSAPVEAPASAGGPGLSSLALLALVPALVGVGYLLVRRSRPGPTAGPDGTASRRALDEVRRLLRDGGTLDRETLVFLAEDAGVARPAAEEALSRWLRAGRVRLERGSEGAETLSWSPAEEAGDALEEVP